MVVATGCTLTAMTIRALQASPRRRVPGGPAAERLCVASSDREGRRPGAPNCSASAVPRGRWPSGSRAFPVRDARGARVWSGGAFPLRRKRDNVLSQMSVGSNEFACPVRCHGVGTSHLEALWAAFAMLLLVSLGTAQGGAGQVLPAGFVAVDNGFETLPGSADNAARADAEGFWIAGVGDEGDGLALRFRVLEHRGSRGGAVSRCSPCTIFGRTPPVELPCTTSVPPRFDLVSVST